MKVIVLGAGVIGVTSAYFLARAGHQVTVLEKNSSPGLGSSYANGCQLSYSHIRPWASSSSLLSLPAALLSSDSFLSIQDFSDKSLRWMFEFYKNVLAQSSYKNSKKLFRISSHSKEWMKRILQDEEGVEFNYQNSGILHFYRNQRKFNAAIKYSQFQDSIGCKSQILTPQECVEKESTLVKLLDSKKLVGGIFYPEDASGDSLAFTRALEKISQQKYGVLFKYNTSIKNILTNHKKITGINTDSEVLVADKYIYALGAYGDNLLSGIKINTKIYPVKGYSLSISADENFIAPKLPLIDPENKMFYSRIGDVFRVAGAIEISGFKNNLNKSLINFLQNSARSTFSDFGNTNEMSQWQGFRPFRPNSLPLICEVKKYGNLFLNTGHGSLGWTLAAGSAKILSDLVSGKGDKNFDFLEEELAED